MGSLDGLYRRALFKFTTRSFRLAGFYSTFSPYIDDFPYPLITENDSTSSAGVVFVFP